MAHPSTSDPQFEHDPMAAKAAAPRKSAKTVALQGLAFVALAGAGVYALNSSGAIDSALRRSGVVAKQGASAYQTRHSDEFQALSGIEGERSAAASASAPPAPAAAPPAQVRTEAAAARVSTPAEARPVPEAAPAVPAAAPAETFDDEHWVFEGSVYDMLSLKPVEGVLLSFRAGKGKAIRSRTDATGTYRVQLPILERGAYAASLFHPAYLDKHFDDGYPPFADMPKPRRAAMRDARPDNEAWRGKLGAKIRRDLVLFPK